MHHSSFLSRLFLALLVPALVSTVYIYHYPAFQGCRFASPVVANDPASGTRQSRAPLRLLVYGDPQLEGDSSLPDPHAPLLPSLTGCWKHVHHATVMEWPGLIVVDVLKTLLRDIPNVLQAYRKRLDLLGNDLYLAHIHRTLRWWTQPTHISVLGDLLGSQWISDDEFARRSDRFWNTVYRGSERVPDHLSTGHQAHELDAHHDGPWSKYLINVAGNHDIGYAGDISSARIRRFQAAFGKVNWNLRLFLPPLPTTTTTTTTTSTEQDSHDSPPAQTESRNDPELNIVVLNDMNLDSPAWSKGRQAETKAFLAAQINETRVRQAQGHRHATILLTHIPLFKRAGICADGPFFTHFSPHNGGGIQEQNHLTEESSLEIMNGLFARAARDTDVDAEASLDRGIILNGHDHEGCDVYHYLPDGREQGLDLGPGSGFGEWESARTDVVRRAGVEGELQGVREVTVRSVMGAYGGNAGLLSAWFDHAADSWVFEYSNCSFGVQHIWWAVHVLDIIAGLVGLLYICTVWVEGRV